MYCKLWAVKQKQWDTVVLTFTMTAVLNTNMGLIG